MTRPVKAAAPSDRSPALKPGIGRMKANKRPLRAKLVGIPEQYYHAP
ncbi:hypothetical protein CBM2609_A130033 [Cupriavidus taiwanensis]|nr:hypothetical protein CBM2609_A130033 [Cupriavidus taiwanensis]SOZ44525.1 hypothetical protein CBM2610_A140033 [Cupriavidus taiwanensis]